MRTEHDSKRCDQRKLTAIVKVDGVLEGKCCTVMVRLDQETCYSCSALSRTKLGLILHRKHPRLFVSDDFHRSILDRHPFSVKLVLGYNDHNVSRLPARAQCEAGRILAL